MPFGLPPFGSRPAVPAPEPVPVPIPVVPVFVPAPVEPCAAPLMPLDAPPEAPPEPPLCASAKVPVRAIADASANVVSFIKRPFMLLRKDNHDLYAPFQISNPSSAIEAAKLFTILPTQQNAFSNRLLSRTIHACDVGGVHRTIGGYFRSAMRVEGAHALGVPLTECRKQSRVFERGITSLLHFSVAVQCKGTS